jgi:hypothetical protein
VNIPVGMIDDTARIVIKQWLIENEFVGFTITGKDDLMVRSDELIKFLESIQYKK